MCNYFFFTYNKRGELTKATPLHYLKELLFKQTDYTTVILLCYRNDEKTAADYKIQGGSVLHLVLALRGGL